MNYTYSNGTVALRSISLNIQKGELIAIMGKNGAGKTTLIRTLNGLIRPTVGKIILKGENIQSKTIATIAEKVGLIFQNPFHQLFSNTVEEEIKFSLKSLNLSKEEIQKRTDNIIKDFGFEKYRNRSPLNLSGGESKKLTIASIICRDPEVLVFDEPTLGQDAKEIGFFINLIDTEMKKGKTILIVTHNVEFTMEYIPRTILLSEGQLIADGATDVILTNKELVDHSSLVLPQIYQFKIALAKKGVHVPETVMKKEEMIEFLKNSIRDNVIEIRGENS